MSAASGAALPAVPRVPGMQRPSSWGHRFGPQLRCDWCRLSWTAHQAEPRPCPIGRVSPARGLPESTAALECALTALPLARRKLTQRRILS